MPHPNTEHGSAFDLDLTSVRLGLSRRVLEGNFVIQADHPVALYFDANGADRILTLPEIERGRAFLISNVGTANILTVKDSASTFLCVVDPGVLAWIVASEDEWNYLGPVFGPSGALHRVGLVPDPGPVGGGVRFLREDGEWASVFVIGTVDAFMNITDGTNTAVASGPDTFKIRSSDGTLDVVVTNNDGTHGDNVNLTVHEQNVDHNLLLNYVADQHVAHTGVVLTAGTGLSGGGDISVSRTFNLDLSDLTTDTPILTDTFAFFDASGGDTNKATLAVLNGVLDHNALLNYVADQHVAHTGVVLTAGVGLSGGGDISVSRTFNLDLNDLTLEIPASGDLFAFYDVSGGDTNNVAATGSGNVVLQTSPQFITDIRPNVNDGTSIGVSGTAFSDIFLALGAVINFATGDVTITHASNQLTFAGGSNGYFFDATIAPTVTGASQLGSAAFQFQNLFLATGGFIDWDNNDVRVTHAANSLTFSGGTSYNYDNSIYIRHPTIGSYLVLDPVTAAQQALINFQQGGAGRWQLGKQTDDSFILFDNVAAATVLAIPSNGSSINITRALVPNTNDLVALGSASLSFADIFLASGAVVNFANGNYTLTHSAGNLVAVGGPFTAPSFIPSASTIPSNGMYLPAANTLGWAINSAAEMQLTASALSPALSDGNALGTTALPWSDIFLAAGGVVNFANGAASFSESSGQINTLGAWAWTSDITPAQITVDQNNYAPTGHATTAVFRLSTDASRNITGLAGGLDGRIVIIHNVGTQSIVLVDESASSTAGNRFALAANVTITADQGAQLQYDATASRWRLLGGGAAGSGDLLAANNLADLASPKTGYDNISVHGSDVASAATIDLDAATGHLIDVTGTTTITAITLANGRQRIVRFTGSLTLTNGASLVLPESENIKTQAGSFAVFVGYAAGVVRCVLYTPAPRAMFSADKGGTDQTGVADATFTEITWGTEIYDKGGHFASNGWTPPKGKVHIQVALLVSGTFITGNQIAVAIYKNGSILKQVSTMASSSISGGGTFVSAEDDASGSDVYTSQGYANVSSGTVTFAGSVNNTFFSGFWIGP